MSARPRIFLDFFDDEGKPRFVVFDLPGRGSGV